VDFSVSLSVFLIQADYNQALLRFELWAQTYWGNSGRHCPSTSQKCEVTDGTVGSKVKKTKRTLGRYTKSS